MRRPLRLPAPLRDERPSNRPPRADFARLVANAPAFDPLLPFTHVTDAYMFRQIMAEERLAPSTCRIFDEQLLYLFYGRPAYRAAAEAESNGLDSYWPVCFVLRPEAVKPKRIFPFDTGAFHFGRFAAFMDHRMIKEDFELTLGLDAPARVVQLFWRHNRAYFENEGHVGFDPEPMDFEAKCYIELIKSRARGPFDERNSAIEVQTDVPIPLENNIIAVILPYELGAAGVLGKIEGFGALALPYGTVRRHTADNMVSQIYDIVRDLYSGKHGKVRCW